MGLCTTRANLLILDEQDILDCNFTWNLCECYVTIHKMQGLTTRQLRQSIMSVIWRIPIVSIACCYTSIHLCVVSIALHCRNISMLACYHPKAFSWYSMRARYKISSSSPILWSSNNLQVWALCTCPYHKKKRKKFELEVLFSFLFFKFHLLPSVLCSHADIQHLAMHI